MRLLLAVLVSLCLMNTAVAEECTLIRDSPMSNPWFNDMLEDGKYNEQPEYHILVNNGENGFREYERKARECNFEIRDNDNIIIREIIADQYNRDKEFKGNIWINWTLVMQEGKPRMTGSTFVCEIYEVPQQKTGEKIHMMIRGMIMKAFNFFGELLQETAR